MIYCKMITVKGEFSLMKNYFKHLMLLLVAGTLVLSGCGGDSKEKNLQKAKEEYAKIQEEVVIDDNDPMNRTIDFAALQQTNPDIYAWIYIPDTTVNYPVAQSSEDDEYYLTHTTGGEVNEAGSIYTEQYNAKDFSDPVTLMYGHTVFMDNPEWDDMFTDLHKYEDPAFLEQQPYIYIYTPDKTIKYRIFSAITFDDRYILDSYDFNSAEEFQNYYDELVSTVGAVSNREISVTQDSKILTLSTCVGVGSDQRWLVSATEVEEKSV